MAIFIGQPGQNNVFNGTADADVFRFALADLNGNDKITGGAGLDTLELTTAGTISMGMLSGVKEIERIRLAAGANTIVFSNTVFANNNPLLQVFGTGIGNDRIDGTAVLATNRLDILAAAGDDTLTGGAGADLFRFAAADLTGLDSVDGKAGSDTLQFSTAGTFLFSTLANVKGIETIALAQGTNRLFLADGLVGSALGAKVVVTSAGTGNDTVDGSALTGVNALDIAAGLGNETLLGGAGNDVFRFGAGGLTAADQVTGGGGTDEIVFSAGVTLTAGVLSQVKEIERITLAAAANTVTLNNAAVANNGGILRFFGTGIGNDSINGGALSSANRIDVTAAAGVDTLKGGAGNDIFRFAVADLGATDSVDGGGGSNTLIFTNAGIVAATAFQGVGKIQAIALAAGTNNVTLSAQVVSLAGGALTVTGGTGVDILNAQAVTAAVAFNGGDGNDTYAINSTGTFTGNLGTGNDTLNVLWTTPTGSQVIDGGTGTNIVNVALDLTAATALTLPAGWSNFQTVDVAPTVAPASVQQIAVTANAAAGLQVNGTSAMIAYAITLAAANQQANGNTRADTLTGSAAAGQVLHGNDGDDVLDTRGGADSAFGDAGNDRIVYDPNDITLSGGTGVDTLVTNVGGVFVLDDPNDQTPNDPVTTDGFENVDASGSIVDTHIAGTTGANKLTGGSAFDTIDGNGGADTIDAAAGGDDVFYSAQAASIDGGSGQDRLILRASASVDLRAADQVAGGGITIGFEDVSAALSTGKVSLVGSNIARSVLGGSTFGDKIVAGSFGADIIGDGGADTLIGGTGDDAFSYFVANEWVSGETIDGRGGADSILVGADQTFLGGITNVESLFVFSGATATITAAIATGLTDIGAAFEPDGLTETVIVNMTAGQSADLSSLRLLNADAGDRLIVNGTAIADTAVLSRFDTVFHGGAGNDVLTRSGSSGYGAGAQIFGDEGDDRIDFAPGGARIDGGDNDASGAGDVLVLRAAATVDLGAFDQVAGGGVTTGFESVDATASTTGVNVTGSDVYASFLTGSAVADTLAGGDVGAFITGGLGGDVLQGGSNGDRFLYNAAAEFAAGESIDGGGGYDIIQTAANLTLGGNSITSVEQITALNGSSVTLSAANAARINAVSGGFFDGLTETFTVNLASGQTVDLGNFFLINPDAGDSLTINGNSGNETATLARTTLTYHGGNGNDAIFANTFAGFGEGSKILGEGGDDFVDFTDSLSVGDTPLAAALIDGGTGTDTLIAIEEHVSRDMVVDLRSATNQANGTSIVRNFENVDWSGVQTHTVTATGTDAANLIIGGHGADTLTGGAGADTFGFTSLNGNADTITDFSHDDDTLLFGAGISGADFDTRSEGLSNDLSATDLFVYTGNLANAAAVRTMLLDNGTAVPNEDIFVVASNGTDTIIYYVPDASQLIDGTIYAVADLGSVSGSTIQLDDFQFLI